MLERLGTAILLLFLSIHLPGAKLPITPTFTPMPVAVIKTPTPTPSPPRLLSVNENNSTNQQVKPIPNNETILKSTNNQPLIDCTGPDGKHLQLTQKACDDFNAAWQKPTIASTPISPVITTDTCISFLIIALKQGSTPTQIDQFLVSHNLMECHQVLLQTYAKFRAQTNSQDTNYIVPLEPTYPSEYPPNTGYGQYPYTPNQSINGEVNLRPNYTGGLTGQDSTGNQINLNPNYTGGYTGYDSRGHSVNLNPDYNGGYYAQPDNGASFHLNPDYTGGYTGFSY